MGENFQQYFPIDQFGEITAIIPIRAGLSGAGVYDVTTERGNFILRLHSTTAETFAAALNAQRVAAEESIAPNVMHVNSASQATVSIKIEGVQLGMVLGDNEMRPQVLRCVAQCLGRLHAIPAIGLPEPDISAMSETLWKEQSQRKGFPDWVIPLGRRWISEGTAAIEADNRRVFSHNDTNPGNILWDGSQIWMVDWDSAAMLHPFLDLAIFSNFTNLPENEAVELLAIQEGTPITREYQTTFTRLRNFTRVFYGAVFMSLIPDLEKIPFVSRETTPTLGECYKRLAQGTLDLQTASGQAQIGAALFKHVPL